MTDYQARIARDLQRQDLQRTNNNIRQAMQFGVEPEAIAKQLGINDAHLGKQALASMALAEVYDTHPSNITGNLSMIMSATHGVNASMDDVIRQYFAEAEDEDRVPFRITIPQPKTDHIEDEVRSDKAIASLDPVQDAVRQGSADQRNQPARPIAPPASTALMRGSNRFRTQPGRDDATIRMDAMRPEVTEEMSAEEGYLALKNMEDTQAAADWATHFLKIRAANAATFNETYSSSDHIHDLVNAETDEEKEVLRRRRMNSLVEQETRKAQRVRDFEHRMEFLAGDIGADKWTFYGRDLTTGSARLPQAWHQSLGEITDIIGRVVDSDTLKDFAENSRQMARTYHLTQQQPELSTRYETWWQERVGSLCRNSPFALSTIAAAGLTGGTGAITKTAMFLMTGAMYGTETMQTAIDNGFSVEEARLRGWVSGTFAGMTTLVGGGGAKYIPQKGLAGIASYPGRITKTILKEIFLEEIPQETMTMLMSDNVPRLEDGSLDYDGITDFYLTLMQDVAFLSAVLGTATQSGGKVLEMNAQRRASKQHQQLMAEAINHVIQQADTDASQTTASEAVQQAATEQVSPDTLSEVRTENEDLAPRAEYAEIDVTQEAETSPRYGIVEASDGKYVVTDWETQHEVKRNLNKQQAIDAMNQLNSGQEIISNRARDILPTSQDIETLTHRQLLTNVFKKMSSAARNAAYQSAVDLAHKGKQMAQYASEQIGGLDLTSAQQTSLRNKIASARTDSEIKNVVATIEALKERGRFAQQRRKFDNLKRYFNRASKKNLNNGGIHYSVYKNLSELFDSYTRNSPKTLNKLQQTQKHIERLRTDASKTHAQRLVEEALIPNSIMNKFSEITRTPINDLTADQLTELNSTIGQYLKANQLYSKLTQNQRARQVAAYLDKAVADMKPKPQDKIAKRFQPKRGMAKTLFDTFVGIKNADIHTVSTAIWGRFSPVSQLIIRGNSKWLGTKMKYDKAIEVALEQAGVTPEIQKQWTPYASAFQGAQNLRQRFSDIVPMHEINIGGTDHKFTTAELMSLIMHTRNRYNLRNVVRNGIATKDGTIGKVTPQEFQAMMDVVNSDPAAMAFLDTLDSFYKTMGSDINAVSRQHFGRDIATEDNYFHIDYVREGGVIGTEYTRDSLVDEQGRLQARTSSNRPVVLRDIFEVITEDINTMSQFIGKTEAAMMLRSLTNYTRFREALRDANAEHILQGFDQAVERFQKVKDQPSSDIERMVGKIQRGVATAALLDPNIALIQPLSRANYQSEVSDKYMAQTLKPKPSKQTLADWQQHWTFRSARERGISSPTTLATHSEVKKLLTGSGTFTDKALTGLHKMDILGVDSAGLITMAEMADSQLSGYSKQWWDNYGVDPRSLDYGSEQYWQAFNDRADHLVYHTQPMFFNESRSQYTGSSNPIIRMYAMFRGFTEQVARINYRQGLMAQHGDISWGRASKTMGVNMLSFTVLATLARFMFAKLLGSDREVEDALIDMAVAPAGLLPFVGYPVSRAVSGLLGSDYPPPPFTAMPLAMIDSILSNSWKTARGINYALTNDTYYQSGPNRGKLRSEVYIKEGISGVLKDFLTLRGVPVRAVERIKWFEDD